MKKVSGPSQSRELILHAFNLLGIETQTIVDCKQLSEETRYRTGQSVSASTIYRMLNAEKQGVHASLRSMQILKDLVENLKNDFIQPLPSFDRLKMVYQKDPVGLQALIQALFKGESDEFKLWFRSLPLRYGELGWEQMLIGNALAQALRTHKAPLDSPWICELIKTPHFMVYYTKTMWDLNEPEKFFVPILEMQLGVFKEHSAAELDELPLETIDSMAFCSGMLLFIQFLTRKEKEAKSLKAYLETVEFQTVCDRSKELHVMPRTRLMCSNFLLHEKEDEIRELIQSVRASLKEEFSQRHDPKFRELAYCVLCDALILRNEIPGLMAVLGELPQPRADTVISDAAFVRMKLYRDLFLPEVGSKRRSQKQGAAFIHGWNEVNLHELLMLKAKQLAGEPIDRTAVAVLIDHSGFIFFNDLLE